MPVLSCGGMRHSSAAVLDSIVDRALSFGVNHFETARMYMGGRSEKDFGRSLQRYPRESFILQTKVRPAFARNPLPAARTFQPRR